MLDEFSTMGAMNLSVPSRLCQQDEDALRLGAESAALGAEKRADVRHDRRKHLHKINPSRLCQQDEDALRIGAESAALVTQSTTNKNKKSGDKAKQAQQRIAAEELLQNQIACKKQEVDILKKRLDDTASDLEL